MSNRTRSATSHKPISPEPSRNGVHSAPTDVKGGTSPPAAWSPFPTYMLPPELQAYTESAASAIGCDPVMVALPLLTALGAAIGNSRRLQVKPGWMAPPLLWTAFLGESGTQKSPAIEAAVRFTWKRQGQAVAAYRDACKRYQWARDEGQKAEEPVCEQCVVDDATVEALGELLEDAPRGLLMARDELSAWLHSFNQYKAGGRGNDQAHFLTMYDARHLKVNRKTGKKKLIFVPRAFVAITGGIQPAVLRRALCPEYFESGLAARLLMAMPPRQLRQWSKEVIDPEASEAMGRVFQGLSELQPLAGDEGPEPRPVLWTEEAECDWVAFFNWHAEEQARATGEKAALLSKLEGVCPRLALILQLAQWAATDRERCERIEGDNIRAAIHLTQWFKCEADRVYTMLRGTEVDDRLRRVLDLVHTHGGKLTARELMRADRKQYPTSDSAQLDLGALVRAGLLRPDYPRPGAQGGQPTIVYVLKEP